jgi:hypothetical protein
MGDIVVLDKIKAKILEKTEMDERSEKNVFLKELKKVKIFPTKPCFSRGRGKTPLKKLFFFTKKNTVKLVWETIVSCLMYVTVN